MLGMSQDSALGSKNLSIFVSLSGVGGHGFISGLVRLSLVAEYVLFLHSKHGQSLTS